MRIAIILLLVEAFSFGCRGRSKLTIAEPLSHGRISVGNLPGSITTADVNNDKRLDLLVANQGDGNVTILLGDGQGGFAAAPGSPFAAGKNPNDVAVGDVNNDGKIDLAFANHDTSYVTVLLGVGGGRFVPAAKSPFTVNSRPHPHGIALGDFNGDRNPDFVVDDWGNNQVTVVFGDGQGNFASPGVSFRVGQMPYQKLRVSDLNRDGKPDVITTNTEGGNVTVLLGNGEGGFSEPPGSPFPANARPFSLAVGDLNGDRIPDLAVANYSGHLTDSSDDRITVLLGSDDGTLKPAPGSPFISGSAPTNVAVGDVNGDGIMDVAVGNYGGNNVTLLLGGVTGLTAAAYSPITVGQAPASIAVDDLNGDGKADIVTANSKDNTVSVLLSR